MIQNMSNPRKASTDIKRWERGVGAVSAVWFSGNVVIADDWPSPLEQTPVLFKSKPCLAERTKRGRYGATEAGIGGREDCWRIRSPLYSAVPRSSWTTLGVWCQAACGA